MNDGMNWFLNLFKGVFMEHNVMYANDETIELIKKFEGFRSKPYKCPGGVWTIGYGRTRGVTNSTKPVTKEEAEVMLWDDLEEFEKGVDELVTYPYLNENQFGALVSFAYNVGLGNLRKSTLLRLLNEGKVVAASEEFKRWNKSAGKTLAGLTKRREAERKLFLKPALVSMK